MHRLRNLNFIEEKNIQDKNKFQLVHGMQPKCQNKENLASHNVTNSCVIG
jgi:hypothetical protein